MTAAESPPGRRRRALAHPLPARPVRDGLPPPSRRRLRRPRGGARGRRAPGADQDRRARPRVRAAAVGTSVSFAPCSLPPVHGYWTLTTYDAREPLVDNPVERYSIGDWNGLVPEADGTVTIRIQHADPGPARAELAPRSARRVQPAAAALLAAAGGPRSPVDAARGDADRTLTARHHPIRTMRRATGAAVRSRRSLDRERNRHVPLARLLRLADPAPGRALRARALADRPEPAFAARRRDDERRRLRRRLVRRGRRSRRCSGRSSRRGTTRTCARSPAT